MILSNNKYKITLYEGEEIEFKTLSADSVDQVYSTLKKTEENPLYIEHVFNFLTENKYDISELRAGIPILVIFSAIKLSGIIKGQEGLPDFYDKARDSVNSNIFYQFYSDIIRVMPTYKLEDLKTKTTNEIFELLSFSEKVVGKPLFDTNKMRQAIADSDKPSSRKGIPSVTSEEIDLIKGILANEELTSRMPGF